MADLSESRHNSRSAAIAHCGRTIIGGAAVATAGVCLFLWYWSGQRGHPDFDQFYYAGLAVRAGVSPYSAVGPNGRFLWSTPFYYPLPAAVVMVPLTYIGLRAAGATFVGITGFALGVSLENAGDRWMYLVVASRGFLASAALGQWSMLMLAAASIPLFGIVGVAKPNVALIAAARWSRRTDFLIPGLVSLALLTLSFAIHPTWLSEWRAALGGAPYQRSPILYPAGFVALAALLRWRRPEARCLLAYAIIPQTPGPYTDFMLFTVPRGRWEILTLTLLSYAPFAILSALGLVGKHLDLFPRYAGISNCVLLLPCVFMLLRRPNRGPAPEMLERWLRSFPEWIRGSRA